MILFNEKDINKIIPSPLNLKNSFRVNDYLRDLRQWATFKYSDCLTCLCDFCDLVSRGYDLAYNGEIEYSYLKDTLMRVKAIILTHFIYLQQTEEVEK